MNLATIIDEAWETREALGPNTKGEVRDAVETVLADLDSGKRRVAEKSGDEWLVHQWLKKAVLLSFRLNAMKRISGAPFMDEPFRSEEHTSELQSHVNLACRLLLEKKK